jgi:hypothetical protein
MYQWKQNWASSYLGRCGDNWVTEDIEIGIPPPGDTGRQDHSMFSNIAGGITWNLRLKEVARAGQAGTELGL